MWHLSLKKAVFTYCIYYLKYICIFKAIFHKILQCKFFRCYLFFLLVCPVVVLSKINTPVILLKFKTRDLHKICTKEEDAWQFKLLVYMPVDLNTIDQKCRQLAYQSLESFRADAHVVLHNVVIFYGREYLYSLFKTNWNKIEVLYLTN